MSWKISGCSSWKAAEMAPCGAEMELHVSAKSRLKAELNRRSKVGCCTLRGNGDELRVLEKWNFPAESNDGLDCRA